MNPDKDCSEDTLVHASDASLLKIAMQETLSQLLPVTSHFTEESDLSLATLSMSRLLKTEATERCEDPLIEARRLELLRSTWKGITPKRFQRPSDRLDPSTTSIVGYKLHRNPAKREASSPPPEELDRQLLIMDKFQSPRMARRALRSYWNKQARYAPNNSEVYQAGALALEQSPITPKGWQGSDAIRWERDRIRNLLSSRSPLLMEVLAGFTRIPYSSSDQPPTRVVDREGRLFIYRSKRSKWQEDLLPELATLVKQFAERTAASKDDRANNNRGSHNFCIAGEDRQSKGKPKASSWHSIGSNSEELDVLFNSPPMQRISECASDLVREHFPRMATRMECGQAAISEKYSLPLGRFGLFHNFCINSPVFEEGLCDVFCDPHTDAKNAAILVCVVFVYYYGNCETTADERIWLAFWEAGIIMQVPAGVFVIYPSALLLHFNLHIEDVLVVTKDGSAPTRENATPFRDSNSQNGGRGSMVWFTQASMLISAELPTDSIKQAEALNEEASATGGALIDTTFNAAGALKEGFFPYDVAPLAPQTTL